MPALISLLIGMLLAQRFKVLVLIPTLPLAAILAIGDGLAHGQAIWAIATSSVLAIVALQIGYLLGIGIHHFMVVARASRMNSSSVPGTLAQRREAH